MPKLKQRGFEVVRKASDGIQWGSMKKQLEPVQDEHKGAFSIWNHDGPMFTHLIDS